MIEGGADRTEVLHELNSIKTHNLIDNKSPSDTTTSGTFVTLLSSALTLFSGRPILFFLNASAFSDAINTGVEFVIQIDSGSDNVISDFFFNSASEHHTICGMVIITPTVGNHTINLRWRRKSGAGTLTVNSDDQLLVYAVEL